VLETFCAARGWTYEVLQDLGSGLNYHKKGLKKLIKAICSGTAGRLIITHKDRLMRFGAELIFSICESFGTEVVIINASEDSSFEDDLVQDVLEIITVFSARLYGSRSRKNKKLLEALKNAANAL
jgi:predicted site-specific integrase-resolvase